MEVDSELRQRPVQNGAGKKYKSNNKQCCRGSSRAMEMTAAMREEEEGEEE